MAIRMATCSENVPSPRARAAMAILHAHHHAIARPALVLRCRDRLARCEVRERAIVRIHAHNVRLPIRHRPALQPPQAAINPAQVIRTSNAAMRCSSSPTSSAFNAVLHSVEIVCARRAVFSNSHTSAKAALTQARTPRTSPIGSGCDCWLFADARRLCPPFRRAAARSLALLGECV